MKNPLTKTGNLTLVAAGVGILLILFLSGCVKQPVRPPVPVPSPPMVQATPLEEVPPQPVTPPEESVLLPADSPEIQQAFEQYLKTGKASVIDKRKKSSFMVFPFGKSQPVAYCAPLELCDIELQAGEQVLDLAAGDSERWEVFPMRSGPASQRVTHVMAKPQDTIPLQTTIVITTDRRTYRVRLVSRLKGAMVHAKFWYPEDLVQRVNYVRDAAHEEQKPIVAEFPSVSLDQLDDRYHIAGEAYFRPSWVANDGNRTFLRVNTNGNGMPVLFVQSEQGQSLVNYRVKTANSGSYFVVDGVPSMLSLVSGSGDGKQVVNITRVTP